MALTGTRPDPTPNACRNGAGRLVQVCARLARDERAVILHDSRTADVAKYVLAECRSRTDAVQVVTVPDLRIHGSAPPPDVGAALEAADVAFCLTSMSLAHTAERQRMTSRGGRFLSLPDYSLEQLASPSLAFDFDDAIATTTVMKSVLDQTREVRVTTGLGTDLSFTVAGRSANACPGVCAEPGTLGSPPDVEVNIAPVEGTAIGTLVVDGSIPCRELGLLSEPLVLGIADGAIQSIEGPQAATLENVLDRLGDPRTRWLAEFGIGLNSLAELCGRMLEDEGCAGTAHFGFGSNATIGGRTAVPFHLDFVIRAPTATLDGKQFLRAGVWMESRV